MLLAGAENINHDIPIDGIVSVLTVQITNVTKDWQSSDAL
jgi:hypothetical protein